MSCLNRNPSSRINEVLVRLGSNSTPDQFIMGVDSGENGRIPAVGWQFKDRNIAGLASICRERWGKQVGDSRRWLGCAQGTTVVLPLPAMHGGSEEDRRWPVVYVGEEEKQRRERESGCRGLRPEIHPPFSLFLLFPFFCSKATLVKSSSQFRYQSV